MAASVKSKLLGQTLRKAGLVSFPQIQVALTDREYYQELKIGEILALRGWIKQQTADFFADEWQGLVEQTERYPLGYYLEKSSLLTTAQIESILQEQKQLWIKFGSIAVIKGLLEKQTVDFFLDSLFPLESLKSHAIGARTKSKDDSCKTSKDTVDDSPTTSAIDYDDIPWVD